MNRNIVVVVLLLLLFCWSGCRTAPEKRVEPTDSAPVSEELEDDSLDDFGLEDEFEAEEKAEPIDPLSGYNRVMTIFNDKVYFWVLRPLARGYRWLVPEAIRLAVNRFFKNLLFPSRFVNNLFQIKVKKAGVELIRFVVNTTVGILGFWDPALKWFKLEAYPEDFGQTLGHYGVGSGFHIVLPFLGPSNLRDFLSLPPDYLLDPVSYIKDGRVQFGVRTYDKINYASLHLGEYESLKKDAVDFYTFLRDAYEQKRESDIKE